MDPGRGPGPRHRLRSPTGVRECAGERAYTVTHRTGTPTRASVRNSADGGRERGRGRGGRRDSGRARARPVREDRTRRSSSTARVGNWGAGSGEAGRGKLQARNLRLVRGRTGRAGTYPRTTRVLRATRAFLAGSEQGLSGGNGSADWASPRRSSGARVPSQVCAGVRIPGTRAGWAVGARACAGVRPRG